MAVAWVVAGQLVSRAQPHCMWMTLGLCTRQQEPAHHKHTSALAARALQRRIGCTATQAWVSRAAWHLVGARGRYVACSCSGAGVDLSRHTRALPLPRAKVLDSPFHAKIRHAVLCVCFPRPLPCRRHRCVFVPGVRIATASAVPPVLERSHGIVA